ncbi:hypothetical protein M3Y94_00659200 [Aphelenchoides besseyi]|nr:hypothetical protein M3Y94_00659200 [Aphelenchoides besseyi]
MLIEFSCSERFYAQLPTLKIEAATPVGGFLDVNGASGKFRYRLYEAHLRDGRCVFMDLQLGQKDHQEAISSAQKSESERMNFLCFQLRLIAKPGRPLRAVCFDADFVLWRDVLVQIASAPYVSGYGFRFLCSRLANVIFIRPLRSSIEARDEYAIRKFRQYLTIDLKSSFQFPDASAPMCFQEEQFLIASQIDCVDKKSNPILLTTHPRFRCNGRFWQQRQVRLYFERLFVGSKRSVVGLHDNDQVVTQLVDLKPQTRGYEPDGWEPGVCFNFLHGFFRRLQNITNRAPDGTIFVAERHSDQSSCVFRPAICSVELETHVLESKFRRQFEKPFSTKVLL